jgi:hypothetical protein
MIHDRFPGRPSIIGVAAAAMVPPAPPRIEVVELDAAMRQAALKMPIKDAMRECATVLQQQLDAQLLTAIERHMGEPLTEPERQVRGHLSAVDGVDADGAPTQAEDERGTVYAMDGVPILWAGPVRLERQGGPGDERMSAHRPLRHLLPESKP